MFFWELAKLMPSDARKLMPGGIAMDVPLSELHVPGERRWDQRVQISASNAGCVSRSVSRGTKLSHSKDWLLGLDS